MTAIQALACDYGGVRMRSRLEARWARFFDGLNTPWEYEPKTYRMAGQRWQYTPDFHLPDLGMIIEVKPGIVTGDLAEKYAAYGPELVKRGECRLFVFVIRGPRPGVRHATFWKHGERTFSFEAALGTERVGAALLLAQHLSVDDCASPFAALHARSEEEWRKDPRTHAHVPWVRLADEKRKAREAARR